MSSRTLSLGILSVLGFSAMAYELGPTAIGRAACIFGMGMLVLCMLSWLEEGRKQP